MSSHFCFKSKNLETAGGRNTGVSGISVIPLRLLRKGSPYAPAPERRTYIRNGIQH